jgi:hypothetical protein
MKRLAASLWVWPAALLLISGCGDDATPGTDAGPKDAKVADAPSVPDTGGGGEDAPVAGDGPIVTKDGPAADRPDGSVVTTDGPVAADGPPASDAPVAPTAMGIGPAGGKIVSSDGKVTLEVPAGAIDRLIGFSIIAVTPAPAGAVGPVYDIEPTGTFFGIPALVTFKPAPTDLGGLALPTLRLANVSLGGSWVPLPQSLTDLGIGTVRARTDHLTRFGLIAGVCQACTDPVCDATTCRFGADPAVPGSGVAGACMPYGKGCTHCVPLCDGDGDGVCSGTPGSNQPGGDCDDNNADISPNAREICGNGKDDNCNGHVDEGCGLCATDADCGGSEACVTGVCQVCDAFCDVTMNCRFGVIDNMPGSGTPGKCLAFGKGCLRCVPGCDADGDGLCTTAVPNVNGTDCNDADPTISSASPEKCGNMIDDDCDGMIDEGCNTCAQDTDCTAGSQCTNGLCTLCPAACVTATCRTGGTPGDPTSGAAGKCVPGGNGCSLCVPACDGDGDGACPGPGGDCNDNNAKISPTAVEICGNNVDDNCNGHIDEGCKICATDADCPGGLEACTNGLCSTCDSFCAADNCHFGANPAIQTPGRCVTFGTGCNRCVPGCDMDGDGFCTMAVDGINGIDCNDADAKVSPSSPEVCGNNIDDDCNGKIDDGCSVCRDTSDTCATNESCTASAQ